VRFAHWPFLILLALVPILYRWWRDRNRPARVTFSLPLPKVAAARSPLAILLALKYAALACFVLALARPQSSYKQTERTVAAWTS
jgi:hypothetical protein